MNTGNWVKPARSTRLVLALLLLSVLSGCSSAGYYWQSVQGQWQIMRAARPIPEWLDEAQTPPSLRQRLALAQRMRAFAVSELHLPDNPSYHRYADLQRRAVVWNVVAAPPLALTLKTWCFPVAGCVGYRGYFHEAEARAQAAALQADGLEVNVYGVPAYSTLGWLNWAGGDPLLNTFIHYPEGELARLLFHELAHQVVYVQDDTMFNESFATAVERLGGAAWLAQQGSDAARQEYAVFDGRRRAFRTLALEARQELTAIYAAHQTQQIDEPAAASQKAAAMARLRARYAELRNTWGGYPGYDAWVAGANNASLGAQAAYDELVPGFEALFVQAGRDWPRFYDAVRALAEQPAAQRHQSLKEMARV